MVIAKKFILEKHFKGKPKSSDLKIVEEELPSLQDGEFLVQAEYLSVDPYMRGYVLRCPIGITMIGEQVAKIIESKNSDFPVGKRVVGFLGWRSHTIVNLTTLDMSLGKTRLVPNIGDLSPSLALGVLGMPGNTAYCGLIEICKPQKGETLVVTAAAGAVGSLVGQIGKNLGLTVIGIAGSDAKCNWLTKELGFDHAINYKTQDIAKALKEAAPNGVDCYFDNVGGEISSTIIYQMRTFGRIAVCGSISEYNKDLNDITKSTQIQIAMLLHELKMEGFIVKRWDDTVSEDFQNILQMVRNGKLKYRETVTVGFENMFDAFVGMLNGDNIGKAIVKACDE